MTDSAKLKFVRVLIKAFVACSIFSSWNRSNDVMVL